MTASKMQHLKKRYAELQRAKERYEHAIVAAFLPGTEVGYWHGSNYIRATVVEASWTRVKVHGATGRAYWLHAYRLHQP